MIDGSVIRAHACASGYNKDGQEKQALGRNKGGFSTKIHALVDALGLPIRFILTPGQSSENRDREALASFPSHTTVRTGLVYGGSYG